MRVFKFGGASLKNAAAIRNVGSILQPYVKTPILIVVSAMGQTTNALVNIVNLFRDGGEYQNEFSNLQHFHTRIAAELFPERHEVFAALEALFREVESRLNHSDKYDEAYDQIVSHGELISSVILHHYLSENKLVSQWIDARDYVRTDNTFREARVDWDVTGSAIRKLRIALQKNFVITQGFIGRTEDGRTTTLGRDGSDFSAAIFASCLRADSVTIWKDVPGVMNADPKRMPTATVFEELPYHEAAEMTYYGASVIHPKTIKPLATHDIPLYVKSFEDPSLPGTKIHDCQISDIPPLIVFKENQCLVSCRVTDYAFITEDHIRRVFSILIELDIRINVMQNSAMSFSFCFDLRESKLKALLEKLKPDFEVYYNTGLTLVTVKNYDRENFETYRSRPGVLLEQYSRSTLQVLMRSVAASSPSASR